MPNLIPTSAQREQRLTEPVLDSILTWQLLIAWAGEGTEELQRLSWWRTDLTDRAGGGDFFQRLLPKTGEWAAFEAVREAALRQDEQIRQRLAQPDLINTLFFWGFEIDEQLADRLAEHKRSEQSMAQRLDFPLTLEKDFDRAAFETVLAIPGQAVDYKVVPEGRELQANELPSLELRSRNLANALLPLSDRYPMPFYRLEKPHAR